MVDFKRFRLEKENERTFCRKMVGLGWFPLKVEGPAGWPDRQFIGRDGFSFFVELKRPFGGVLSEIQKHIHALLRLRGFIVEVANDCSDEEIARITGIVEAAQVPRKGWGLPVQAPVGRASVPRPGARKNVDNAERIAEAEKSVGKKRKKT